MQTTRAIVTAMMLMAAATAPNAARGQGQGYSAAELETAFSNPSVPLRRQALDTAFQSNNPTLVHAAFAAALGDQDASIQAMALRYFFASSPTLVVTSAPAPSASPSQPGRQQQSRDYRLTEWLERQSRQSFTFEIRDFDPISGNMNAVLIFGGTEWPKHARLARLQLSIGDINVSGLGSCGLNLRLSRNGDMEGTYQCPDLPPVPATMPLQ